VKCGQERYKNQPKPIENYEPGHSSIAEKEAIQFWDEVMNDFDEVSQTLSSCICILMFVILFYHFQNLEHPIPPLQNRSSSKKSNLAQ